MKKHLELELGTHSSFAGWYKIEKYKADNYGNPIPGSRQLVADWFPNVITNQGLNRLGSWTLPSGGNTEFARNCQVGSGSATPQFTDVGLQTFVAGTNTIQSTSSTFVGAPDYWGATTNTYRFAAGTATGNLTEVGVGWATTGNTLWSRALIVDGLGNPITITVLSDEVLDVSYTLRNYPPVTDTISNVTITGLGTISTTNRAAFAGSTTWSPWSNASFYIAGGVSFAGVFNGNIGAITAEPSGATNNANTLTPQTYVNNSLQVDVLISWSLTQGNVAGGIRSLLVHLGTSNTTRGRMQHQFDTIIPKDGTRTLSMLYRNSWNRL